MSERVTLDAEFVRRALGFGREGNPADVQVTPDALPPDFPLRLPDLAGLRVLGGIRSAAPRWVFSFPGAEPQQSAEHVLWRAFLDVPAPQPEVMETLLAHFLDQGWQTARMFQAVFVEAARSQWLAARCQPPRILKVFVRGESGMTQVWLETRDTDSEHAGHLLGRLSYVQDQPDPLLPTLTLPGGWTARMLSGHGGPVCSQTFLLRSAGTRFDPAALLSELLPQLERQGWRLLCREDGPECLSVYRTALGLGTLFLRAEESQVRARIVHATAGEERGAGAAAFEVP
ncbi:hypothetical protein [Deinococcus sp. YIM 77859]|uniref:hypothetical protein n=1 Tax=Deinococcus sp. YIM 77859 TaxID=1540221 RepID=UPI00054D291B|nr:hypothetical protein [Deinococcus sp. YIM 77859]